MHRSVIPLTAVAAALGALLMTPAAHGAPDSDVRISGFVDASYAGNLDTRTDTFGLDQAEVDVERTVGERGAVRADLEWVKDGDDWVLDVEQGYLDWVPPFAPRLTCTFGKFNAPMGFELLDAPDMYQYSHALVFDYGLPTNLTGAMAAAAVTDQLDVRVFLVNGWDSNDLGGPGPKTVGGRAGFALGDRVSAGVSAITGSETDDSGPMPVDFTRTVFDADLTITPRPDVVIGAELNLGSIDIGSDSSSWTGFLVMSHVDFNEWAGLTGRFDWFDDQDDIIFGSGFAETRMAFTVAPTFVLGDGMGALIEVRIDTSSDDVFVDSDGAAKSSTTSAAFEMTYGF